MVNWRSLGQIEPPTIGAWDSWPFEALGTEEIFRVSFEIGNWDLWNEFVRGWLYLRWRYPGGPEGYSRATKIWVQPSPTIIELPLPPALAGENRKFECFRRSSRWGGDVYADGTYIFATLEAGA